MNARWMLALVAIVLTGLIAFVASTIVRRESSLTSARGSTSQRVEAAAPELSEVAERAGDEAASADRRSRAASALTGRVIDAERGQGLAGFFARSWQTGEVAGEAISEATGYFQLPAPPIDEHGVCSCRVRVQAPWGWTMVTAVADVQPRADGAFDELLFRARPARFGKARGKLVDYDTREFVPDYMLRIGTADGSREQVVSNADGVFTSERDYPEGLLELLFHDFETSAQGANEERLCYRTELAFDPRATEPPTIAIPVGPTYRLDLSAPADVLRQLLFAELRPARVDESLHVVRGDAQVRGSESRWVRFRPQYARPDPLVEPWKLAVASTDGLWFGEAAVPSMRGVCPATLSITLEARSQLLGRLRDRSGDPIGQANVSLGALGNGTVQATTQSSGNGLFAFELVPAGRYSVTAISSMHEIKSAEVTIRGGERAEIELVLDDARIAGAVSGTVVATQEPNYKAPNVVLASLNPSGRWIEQPTQWRHEGEQWLADFRVDSVPAGDYELLLSGYRIGAWSPETMRITPPAEGLRFVQVTSICVAVEAADARDGRALAACRAVLLSSGCRDWPETYEREWWDCIAHAGELDADARWIIAAEGFAPRWGTRDELIATEDGFVARASLQRGWGIEIDAFGPGFAPIAGAEVLLDDEAAGATDRDGVLRIVRESGPARIDVHFRDWRVDATSRAALRGAIHNGDPRAVVSLSPP